MIPAASPADVEAVLLTGATAPSLSAPAPRLNPASRPVPRLDLSQFRGIEVSDASRQVASAVLARSAQTSAFSNSPNRDAPAISALDGALRIRAGAEVNSGATFDGSAVGIQITAAPDHAGRKPKWWFIGGAGRSSYAVAPGGLREFTVAPVAAESTIGDAHFGVGMELGDNAFASVGYVRENRRFSLGAEDWEEEDHYLGVSVHARW